MNNNCNKNVFEIWLETGKKLPLKVRRWSWKQGTYFIITKIEIKWDYYKKTGKLYGKAYGYFYRNNKNMTHQYLSKKLESGEAELICAGCYQWCKEE